MVTSLLGLVIVSHLSPKGSGHFRGRVVCMSLSAWSSLCVLIMTGGVGSMGPWCHHYYLCAMPTPNLRSLGLSVAHRVAGPVDGLRTQA
jgi:hypothetical protein